MVDPEGLTLDQMKELVVKLNEMIIDREMALAVEKANHEEESKGTG